MKLKKYLEDNKYTQMSFIELIEMAKGSRIPQGTFAKWITGWFLYRLKKDCFAFKGEE